MNERRLRSIFLLFTFIFFFTAGVLTQFIKSSDASSGTLGLQDIWIRDPNILFYKDTYYMTGTTAGDGFLGYSSTDLVHWTADGYIYHRNASSAWALQDFWAPEMRYKNGFFYLFFSGKTSTTNRSTGVAVASSPLGPYVDLARLTPPEWNCLDGHEFTDVDDKEYVFFSHEWVGEPYGEMWVQQLSPDYTHLVGNRTYLFKGTDAPWSSVVVDGPAMLYHDSTYDLFWSSFSGSTYCCGYARSNSLLGPYVQSQTPVINTHGGHCSFFKANGTGQLMIVYHQPDSPAGSERARIDGMTLRNGTWYLSSLLGVEMSSWNGVLWIALICVVALTWILKRKQLRVKNI